MTKVNTYGIAHAMLAMKIVPVEVMRGDKKPLRNEWQRATLASSKAEIPTWREGNNVGALWGEPSGWIIDVDIDCEDAVKAAHLHLPQTLTYGRESSPRSHHLFHCVGAENTKYRLDKIAMQERGSPRASILEVRANGSQTVFVGSTHPSGERVRWDQDVETCAMLRENIASIEWDCLAQGLKALATHCGWRATHCGWREEAVEAPRILRNPANIRIPARPLASGDGISTLIAEIANTPKGSRNDILHLNAFKVFQRCEQEGLNFHAHAAMLMDAAQRAGLKEAEARNTIESAQGGAAKNPSPAVLEVLLKAGADVNAKDTDGTTPLHSAARDKPSPAVLDFLLKADVNAKDADGNTPLHAAAAFNPSPAVLEILLKAGADVNAKDADGSTPLHAAARDNPSPAVLEILLKAGADVNAKDKDGDTPLHWAALDDPSPAAFEVLLKAGADVNAKTTDGETPLHAAAAFNSSSAVLEVLLKAGADVNAKNTEGETPLHAAAQFNSSPAVLEVLLKAGADVNAKGVDGTTPLHVAAEYNSSPAVLEVLLKAGADPRALNFEGKTSHAVAQPEYRDILWKAMMDKPLK